MIWVTYAGWLACVIFAVLSLKSVRAKKGEERPSGMHMIVPMAELISLIGILNKAGLNQRCHDVDTDEYYYECCEPECRVKSLEDLEHTGDCPMAALLATVITGVDPEGIENDIEHRFGSTARVGGVHGVEVPHDDET